MVMVMVLAICKLLFSTYLAGLLTGRTLADQVVIKEGSMDQGWFASAWQTTRSYGQVWTDPYRDNQDFSHVCGRNMDSVLMTRHVSLRDAFAEVVYVKIEAEVTDCSGQPCNNSQFEIFLYRNMSEPELPEKRTDKANYFKSNFVAIYNFTNQTTTALSTKQNQTFNFLKRKSEGVTLGIKSSGACGTVYRINMHYFYCKAAFISGVRFPKTISPAGGEREVTGYCSTNSAPLSKRGLKSFCQSNGEWRMSNDSKCFCNKGYEAISEQTCSACSADWFKPSSSSNEKCRPCPSNNAATKDKSGCKCKDGYYKFEQSMVDSIGPCYALPHYQLKIHLIFLNKDAINITWQAPPQQSTRWNETINYEVTCHRCLNYTECNRTIPCQGLKYTPQRRHNLTQQFVVVSKIKFGHTYMFRIYPRNSLNKMVNRQKWNYTEVKYWNDEESENERIKEKGSWPVVYVVAAACAALFLTVIILIIIMFKRRANEKRRQRKMAPTQVELPKVGRRLYIDPTIYESPEEALNEFACELERSAVVLDMLIGGGEFGDVYKGQMCCKDGSVTAVAVKTLKQDADLKSERDFLLEASIMAQFKDPNVISLLGVITKSTHQMIIIEFMSNGSLDNFLKNNENKLSRVQLIAMARGVASGMKYLAAINFVHRDLAARNILVNERLFCKISDFGLSRALETSQGEYSTSGGKIPVRWTAPEAIEYRKFSSASDVWSYGILLWEIISLADRPYGEWDNFKVMQEVNEGYRLSAPEGCPKPVHDLMLRCWNNVRFERPSFSDILTTIDEWITRPGLLCDDTTAETEDVVLGDWLRSIKMGNYTWHLLAAGYRTPEQLSGLKDSDLKEMGITLIGHRNKILKGVKALEATKEAVPLSRTSSSILV